jgi:hypothetical protein
MYRGRWQQGEERAIGVQCYNSSGVPAWPDAAPQVSFYGSSGKIGGLARSLPALERSFTVGLFQNGFFLDNQGPVGIIRIVYRWSIGSFFASAVDIIEVIPGGDPRGYVLALDTYYAPQAQFLVQQLSSGKIRAGQNPRL